MLRVRIGAILACCLWMGGEVPSAAGATAALVGVRPEGSFVWHIRAPLASFESGPTERAACDRHRLLLSTAGMHCSEDRA
ncbi:MAG TPA: hypothetical protein VHQ91_04130 [Geminicoccaceae bacterium]|jgi:hypothetical protein|nr:hypothetical protein [Geminicoccaceae bacterium]